MNIKEKIKEIIEVIITIGFCYWFSFSIMYLFFYYILGIDIIYYFIIGLREFIEFEIDNWNLFILSIENYKFPLITYIDFIFIAIIISIFSLGCYFDNYYKKGVD